MASASLSLVLDPSSSLDETPKQTCTTEEAEHCDFISLLGLAQKWDVPFLSITWQPALDPLGEGASAEVYQSTVYKSIALAFKDSTAKKTGKRRIGFKDIMREILIVRAPYIRKSPNIIDLLGITWNLDPSENQVWPVLVYRKGTYGTLRDYICNPQRMKEALQERLSLCSGVLYGLATLHSAGMSMLLRPSYLTSDRGCTWRFEARKHHYSEAWQLPISHHIRLWVFFHLALR
jgi:hypothetical protein